MASRIKDFDHVFGKPPDYGKAAEIQEMLFHTNRCWDVFMGGLSQTNITTKEEATRIAEDYASRGNKVTLVRYSRYMAEGNLVIMECFTV